MNFIHLPAQAPADAPPPGVEAVSAVGAAARSGTLRADDQGLTRFQQAPAPEAVFGSEFPFQVPAGVPRMPRHPAGPVGTINPHDDWNTFGGVSGVHGELVQSISPPEGELGAWGSSPKTWRAAPEPWDADAWAGWRGAEPLGDE